MTTREKYTELRSLLSFMMESHPEIRTLWKTQTTRKYNYFITEPEFADFLIDIIQQKSISTPVKFLDLGAGAGFMFEMLPKGENIEYLGYEIEDILVSLSQVFSNVVIKKDIITLNVSDVQDYNILYFYEPLLDQSDCENFAYNLNQITNTSQIIIYHKGGPNMSSQLELYFDFEDIFMNELFILTKKN